MSINWIQKKKSIVFVPYKVCQESQEDHAVVSSYTGLKIRIPAWPASSDSNVIPKPAQLVAVESKVLESIRYLRDWNHIHGPLLSVDEVIEPPEERDLPEPVLDGRVKVIADEVCREMAIANGA